MRWWLLLKVENPFCRFVSVLLKPTVVKSESMLVLTGCCWSTVHTSTMGTKHRSKNAPAYTLRSAQLTS